MNKYDVNNSGHPSKWSVVEVSEKPVLDIQPQKIKNFGGVSRCADDQNNKRRHNESIINDRKQRNKQRAALAGTNKTYHDVKFMRCTHIESHYLFTHETDGN